MGKAINRLVQDWRRRIAGSALQEWAERLYSEAAKDAVEVDNPGTVMKLLFLWNYMRFPYLHIMASRRDKQRAGNRQAKLFYLDPYAGNGIVKVKRGNEWVSIPGSSILALLAPILLHEERNPSYHYYWDIMVLNDTSDKYRRQLINRYQCIFNRLSTLESLYKIYYELPLTVEDKIAAITDYDCAQQTAWFEFRRFFERVRGQEGWIHGLIFLDPPSPGEMPLGFLKKLLSVPSDVIALLHSGIFAELVNTKIYSPDTLTNILDCDTRQAESLLQQTHGIKELGEMYVNKFCELLRETRMQGIISGSPIRDVIKPIRLSTGRRHYHLVVATRTTGGKEFEAWQKWLNEFAEEVEKLSDLDRLVIDILSGKQAMLNSM
jgi:hypothetical protein